MWKVNVETSVEWKFLEMKSVKTFKAWVKSILVKRLSKSLDVIIESWGNR